MAFSRIVPLTRRDFFWDDPFFSNFWEDFERLRGDIWRGNQDFFSRFNQQEIESRPRLVGSKLINTSGSFMKESSMAKSFKKESSSSLSNFARNSFTSDSDFGLSRRWLMPKGIFDEDLANFQLKDEVLCVKDDDNKFEVSIDTHGFNPEDLQVKIQDNVVSIQGKHEEKTDESNSKSYVSRHLAKSFTLPQGCKMETVSSNLSKDGLLIVSAPKIEASRQGTSSRKIPIETEKLGGTTKKTFPELNLGPRPRLVGSKLIKPKLIDY